MDTELFREKNLKRISSPEELDSCLKVAGPSLWMVVLAVVILVAAALVWGVLGSVETRVYTTAACLDGQVVCELDKEDGSQVLSGMTARIDGVDYAVESVERQGAKWLVCWNAALPDGSYDAQIVTETEKPIKYLVN